jgi:hypothetical protein
MLAGNSREQTGQIFTEKVPQFGARVWSGLFGEIGKEKQWSFVVF